MSANKKIQGTPEWWSQMELDPKVPDGVNCDFRGCDRLSTQWFQVLCCKEAYLMCDEHVQQTLFTIKALSSGTGTKCKFCGLVWDTLDFITVPQPLAQT